MVPIRRAAQNYGIRVGYPIRTIAVNRGKDLASRVQRCPLLPQMLKAAGWKENRGLGVEEQVWVWKRDNVIRQLLYFVARFHA